MMFLANLRDKLLNMVMPDSDYEEQLDNAEELAARQAENAARYNSGASNERRVANGVAVSYISTPNFGRVGAQPTLVTRSDSQPQLTVHTTKVTELKVKVHVPTKYNHVSSIADHLKSGMAVVVNFDSMEPAEQRRVCDFVNGACYVLGGKAQQISRHIMMYVPSGVDISEAIALAH